jgi:hypothetical protein
LRIFLSSTSVDLSEARQKILKLLSVIPADLVHMETFGSDETRSVDYSLGQVRSSDLFVGVYAERYGTLDSGTGRSITELEYREALKMSEDGSLGGLLVYILNPKASWRVDLVDRDPGAVLKLTALKEDLKAKHTITYFSNIEDLSLNVLRDVLRKIGIGHNAAFKARAIFPEVASRIARPLGMEHYTERDARWFRGRENDIASICDLVETNSEVLLIGDSGMGKTSLVQAGVFPALRKKGWLVASCRPLDVPDESIPPAIWHQLMEGCPPDESIRTILSLVAEAHYDRPLLVVIDQIEDIIPQLATQNSSGLLRALTQIYMSPPPNLHMLLCYRGDAEPRVGHYWQAISGSAAGLPRYYLGPLGREAAVEVVRDLVAVESNADGVKTLGLVEEVISDTEAESMRSLGIQLYPPFLQMVAEAVVKAARDSGGILKAPIYQTLGKARQIIGRYLLNQLRLLGPRTRESQAVMISLAARARRFRKTVEEIAKDTSLPVSVVEACLSDLANLRLVHTIEGKWEIVHDFLAQKVIEELVAPEEREARVFRDVVVAKAAAFGNTGELLTYKEHLGAYAHRQRIVLSAEEIELLFMSSLAGNGPVRYFLRSVPDELPVSWAKGQMRSSDDTIRINAYRFLLASGKDYPLANLVEAFSDYKLQSELASFVLRFSTSDDLELLLKLRRKKAETTRLAAVEQLERTIETTDASSIQKLLHSRRSEDTHLLCRILLAKTQPSSLPQLRAELDRRGLESRIRAICGLGAIGGSVDAERLLERIGSRDLSEKEREAGGHALAYWAQARRRRNLLQKLLEHDDPVCKGALWATKDRLGLNVSVLLEQYPRLQFDTSAAVLRTATLRDYLQIKRFVSRTPLNPPLRDIIIALLRVGGADAARYLTDLIGRQQYKVEFWNVPILAAAFGQAVGAETKEWLGELTESDEFWQYTGNKRSLKPLPVRSPENLYLFKRLIGVALAGLCDATDWLLLKRLVFHDYWQIEVAAAQQIVKFGGIEELDEMVEQARNKDKTQAGVVNALMLLDAKLFAQQ